MNIFKKCLFNETNSVSGLTFSMRALYVYNYFQNQENSVIYVMNSLFEANKMFQYIQDYTDQVLLFPMDDFFTSVALASSPELQSNRLSTLFCHGQKKIIVTNLMGYLRYLPSLEKFKNSTVKIKKNTDYSMKELIEKLDQLGYKKDIIVTKTGDMALRGFVIDIFPIDEENPIRLEFFGDTIESIRVFDTETQKMKYEIDEVSILPNTEFLVDKNDEELSYQDLPKYTDVVNIEKYFAPCYVFFDQYQDLLQSYNTLLEDIKQYNISKELPADTAYMHKFEPLKQNNHIYFTNYDNKITNINEEQYNSYELDYLPKNIKDIKELLNKYIKDKKTVIICLKNRYQVNNLIDELKLNNIVFTNEKEIINNKINIIIKQMHEGFIFENYVIITERELFHKKDIIVPYKNKFKMGTRIKDINKLNIGDYIVHSVHGIGKYVGLKTLKKNNVLKDYLAIEYKGGDKLYIPVEKIDYISKYSSNDNIVPKINKLGGTEWAKTKIRVRKKIESIAGDLLKLYAARQTAKGFAFVKDDENQILFESEFVYEDTVDQHKVSEEIKRDMEKPHPMDRLLCGDVGYGKTEVAFRAMYKAVLSGKQVAYLCPTTILSNQHYQNAIERFKNTGTSISLLNRFVKNKQLKETIEKIQEGKTDIVIGTHRLLSDDVKFKDLGLLVIDEEQRFGVKHKEKIKSLKNNIDVLTLSATPIPRTLQMSMTGLRSLSLIETPPVDRYPVQTYVLEENLSIIKDAIYKELARQGQVFILYNYVDGIEQKQEELKRLVPEARIIYAHGRMSKEELENVMIKFIDHEYDILLCTTIIETGIDIPNVNTLLIYDSDRFGLSQLYQIRGRVGRSNKIAYCYLMYRPGNILSTVASKRLNVIKEFTELGNGFRVAMRDLSIRGAGDILGSEQAGFIDSVGVELYMSMLNEEIDKLKGKKVTAQKEVSELPLVDVSTNISDQYVLDPDLKIEIHKKINQIESHETLLKVKEELEDRFGKLSDNLLIYMHEEWFEKLAKKYNIKDVKQTVNFISIILPKELTDKIEGDKLFLECSNLTRNFRFSMSLNRLVVTLDFVNLDKHFIYYLIDFIKIMEKSLKKDEK